MSRTPDDWGNGYTLCPTCKHYFHKSGTMECICVQCTSPDCDELVDPQEQICNTCTTDSE